MKRTLTALSLVLLMSGAAGISVGAPVKKHPAHKPAAAASKTVKPATKSTIPDSAYKSVSPLDLVKDPDGFLNDRVSFEATFNGFNPVGLDYKGAMRSSKDYISFLVQRPDVNHHVIPLSELKLVYPRKQAEKTLLDIQTGDKVAVKGKVYSNALGDPWVDVEDMVITQPGPEHVAKNKKKKGELD
jgi:hypothetical protein